MATYKEFSDAAKKQWMDQSQIDAARWKIVNRGSTTTNTSTNNTNSGGDIYGDVSRTSTAGQNKSEWIATSTWLSYKPTDKQDLWDLAQFGADAYTMEWNKSGSLAKRNDIIANNLYLSGEGVEDYLNQYDSFKNASDEDKKNTIRAINERLWIIKANDWDNNDGLDKKWDEGDNLWDNWILGDRGYTDTTPGFYRDAEGNEIKIYGYQALSDDQKKYVDQMSDAEKKKISNMWAKALQDYIKQYADSNYEKDYREKMYGLAKDMRGIQTQQEAIQYGQQLRQAQEQVDNLMQNWEYLWNMGMPGLSKTKLQAISDSIKEANTSLDEMVKLQNLAKDASAKNWEIDVAQYEKQISDIVRDLNYKIPQEIQNALNKYTVAELEGNLDTIDWVVAFKKSLLDDLDNNISWMTSASLQQMQYITDSYMTMADKAYEEAKEYQQNANTVNTEMSGIRWYYVDGNGNPILDSDGQPIKVPQWAPIDPVFDKESGKLIQFGYDENGNIVANVTQVYDGDQSATQSLLISMLESGQYTPQEIAKYTGIDLDKVLEMQSKVNVLYRSDGLPKEYSGKNYTAVDSGKVQEVINNFINTHKEGSEGWSCGHLANDYLEALWIGRLYGDYLDGHDNSDKIKNINSSVPAVGGIVVMDSTNCPDNWHVAIVIWMDKEKGTIDVLESNWKGDKKVHKNTYDMNSDKIYGYFDPQKSIDNYNKEWIVSEWGSGNGFTSGMEWYYNKYLTAKMTKDDWTHLGMDEATFKKEAVAYRNYIDSQVSTVAQDMMNDIYEVYMRLTNNGTEQPSMVKMNAMRVWAPGTAWRKYKNMVNQLLSSTALQKLIDLKKNWATFGALSDNELGFITDASTWLDMSLNRNDFVQGIADKFNEMAKYYGIDSLDQFAKNDNVWWGSNQEEGTYDR